MKLLSANFGRERTKGLVFHCEALTMLHESVNNLGFAFTKPLLGAGVRDHISWKFCFLGGVRAHSLFIYIKVYKARCRRRRRNKTTRSARAFHI
jgi:hypothetical protein